MTQIAQNAWRLALATMLVVSAAACQVVGEIDDREVATPLTAATSCEHATLPSKPSSDGGTASGGDVAPVVFALDLAIAMGRDGGVSHGFDLDGVCSTTGTGGSCKRCQDPDDDDPSGRDNGVALALANPFFFTLLNEMPEETTNKAKSDRFHLLVEIVGWNGEPNDPDVVVRFYRSHGAQADGGGWSTTEDSYVSEVAPAKVAREAWIRDGRLVAKADTLDFDFAGPGFGGAGTDNARLPIHLDEAWLMLPMTKSSDGPRVIRDGIITGRWATTTALAALAHVNTAGADAAAPRWLCGSDDGYAVLKRALCVNADISARSANDNKGSRCDAISIVFDATGTEGQRGSERLTLPSTSGCNDKGDWQDDCTSALQIQNCTFAN